MAEELLHPNLARDNPPDPEAVEAARDKQLGIPLIAPSASLMAEGVQSEIVDRRVIDLDPFADPSPSADSPPEEPLEIGTQAAPSSYDPAKYYTITLFTNADYANRTLTPATQHLVSGTVATAIKPAIADAVEWTG
jgi:hypothetical protein